MHKRIVYTRHDGGVSICQPSDEIITWLGCGGMWNDHPRGVAERQIASMINRGVLPDAAHRYARAVTMGGCTTAEAMEIIRDRDCAHLGTAIELWDLDEVPTDRWFRDAWCRSHNGGPIGVNLKLARLVQFNKIHGFVAAENKRRAADLDRFDRSLEVDFLALRERIRAARDENELRTIWL